MYYYLLFHIVSYIILLYIVLEVILYPIIQYYITLLHDINNIMRYISSILKLPEFFLHMCRFIFYQGILYYIILCGTVLYCVLFQWKLYKFILYLNYWVCYLYYIILYYVIHITYNINNHVYIYTIMSYLIRPIFLKCCVILGGFPFAQLTTPNGRLPPITWHP